MSILRYLSNKIQGRTLESKHNGELKGIVKDLEGISKTVNWTSGTSLEEGVCRAKMFEKDFSKKGDLYGGVEVYKGNKDAKVYCDMVCLDRDKGSVKRKGSFSFTTDDLPVRLLK